MNRIGIVFFSFILLAVISCNGVSIEQPTSVPIALSTQTNPTPTIALQQDFSTPTLAPTMTATPLPTETAVPTQTAVAPTQTPLPTSTPVILSSLAPLNLDLSLDDPQLNESAINATQHLESWLTEAWQLNTSVETVSQMMIESNWQREAGEITAVDIDNDGVEEWLITFYLQPQGALFTRAGDFWVFGQEGIEFRFFQPVDYFNEGANIYFWAGAPTIFGLEDFTGDDAPDMLLERQECGAHTCIQDYFLYSSHFGAYTNVIQKVEDPSAWGRLYLSYQGAQAPSISITYGESEIIETDGVAQFRIIGGQPGSAGAGFVRLRTETWGWTGEAFELIELSWNETDFQMHILREANDRYLLGDIDGAGNLYQRLFNDPTLTNYEGVPSTFEDDEYLRVVNFAIFKLMVIGYQSEDSQLIETWRNWLVANSAESNYVQIADLLWEQYQSGVSLEEACRVVNTAVSTLPLEDEMPIEYGYANPQVTKDQLCLEVGDW